MSLTDLKNVINVNDLVKINDQFAKKKGDFKKMLIFMNNKKIMSENKANQEHEVKKNPFGEYVKS